MTCLKVITIENIPFSLRLKMYFKIGNEKLIYRFWKVDCEIVKLIVCMRCSANSFVRLHYKCIAYLKESKINNIKKCLNNYGILPLLMF